MELSKVIGFGAFGSQIAATPYLNPGFEFRLSDTTALISSMSNGVVTYLKAKSTDDFEVHIRTAPNSIYLIAYHHVHKLFVTIGTHVIVGTTLGTVAINHSAAVPFGEATIQINTERTPERALCPELFGTIEFNAVHKAAFRKVNPGLEPCLASAVIPDHGVQVGGETK